MRWALLCESELGSLTSGSGSNHPDSSLEVPARWSSPLGAERELLGCLPLWSQLDAQGEVGKGQTGACHVQAPPGPACPATGGCPGEGLLRRAGSPPETWAEAAREGPGAPPETGAEAAPGSPILSLPLGWCGRAGITLGSWLSVLWANWTLPSALVEMIRAWSPQWICSLEQRVFSISKQLPSTFSCSNLVLLHWILLKPSHSQSNLKRGITNKPAVETKWNHKKHSNNPGIVRKRGKREWRIIGTKGKSLAKW